MNKEDRIHFEIQGVTTPDRVVCTGQPVETAGMATTTVLDSATCPACRIALAHGAQLYMDGPSSTLPADGSFEPREPIRGILLKIATVRAMGPDGVEENGVNPSPVCHSPDGIYGEGRPGGECNACPFKGGACEERRVLHMLLDDRILPLAIHAAGASIRNVREYRMSLAGQRLPHYGVETELTLEAVDGDASRSRITLRKVGELTPDQRHAVRGYVQLFSPFLKFPGP